jgi:hypothetical protein
LAEEFMEYSDPGSRQFKTHLRVPASATPGHYRSETAVNVTVEEYDKEEKIWKWVRTFELTDSLSIWVRGTQETKTPYPLHGQFQAQLKFPWVIYRGEQPTGEVLVRNLLWTQKAWTFRIEKVEVAMSRGRLSSAEERFVEQTNGSGGPSAAEQTLQIKGPRMPEDVTPDERWHVYTTITLRAFPEGDNTPEEEAAETTIMLQSTMDVIEKGMSECVIATAAFGSEMAPQVVRMRRFRNDKIMPTFSGQNFMRVFNVWYYSWGKHVANEIRNDDQMRAVTRTTLLPLMGAMAAAEGTHALLSFFPELAAITSILIAAFLCGAFYIAPLMVALDLILGRLRITGMSRVTNRALWLIAAMLGALAITLLGNGVGSVGLSTLGMTLLAICVSLGAALLTVVVFWRLWTLQPAFDSQ